MQNVLKSKTRELNVANTTIWNLNSGHKMKLRYQTSSNL